MAIGKISGKMLQSDLERDGSNLSFDSNLLYLDVANRYVGVSTSSPGYPLHVVGDSKLSNIIVSNTTISSTTGVVSLGSNANVSISGGGANYILSTDGSGNLSWSDIGTFTGNILGNAVALGTNSSGQLSSSAASLTTSTTVTDGIALLNQVLGKLVPLPPPSFPGSGTLSLSTSTSTGRICNFTQTDNSGWGNLSVAGGTSVSAARVATYATNTISTVGPGDTGTVTGYLNGSSVGSVALTGSSNGTYTSLIIANNQDYHNVNVSVASNFWYSFDARLSGSGAPAGWNRANIYHSGSSAGTNTITWYYDSSTPGTPTFSNTNISLTTNSSTYSSTIPHLNTTSQFTITGNVSRLSGDTYPLAVSSNASSLVTGTAGGALAAPVAVTYASAGVTVPLTRNLYVSSGSAYFTTTSNIASGFSSSASGPTVSVNNNYATGTSSALTVSGSPTILYKTGTSSLMEETTLTFGSTVGTGSGLAARIINPGNSDTPTYSANATAFNSQSSTLQTYDATIVAGVLKHDQTNYSSGYLPVGPNLSSGRSGSQYFTFKFVRTSVSKFDIKFTGNIAGLWVALPGSGIDTSSTLNGWLTMATAYAGAGQPGAGTGGNGSNGCALGGIVTLNSAVTAHRKTCTFGTASSSSTATNEIYVRIKLTSGQTVTALSLETASN